VKTLDGLSKMIGEARILRALPAIDVGGYMPDLLIAEPRVVT
jgi:hypothetical protein